MSLIVSKLRSIFFDLDLLDRLQKAQSVCAYSDVGNAPKASAVKKNGEREEEKERKALESRAKEVNVSGEGVKEESREHKAETRDTGRSREQYNVECTLGSRNSMADGKT